MITQLETTKFFKTTEIRPTPFFFFFGPKKTYRSMYLLSEPTVYFYKSVRKLCKSLPSSLWFANIFRVLPTSCVGYYRHRQTGREWSLKHNCHVNEFFCSCRININCSCNSVHRCKFLGFGTIFVELRKSAIPRYCFVSIFIHKVIES